MICYFIPVTRRDATRQASFVLSFFVLVNFAVMCAHMWRLVCNANAKQCVLSNDTTCLELQQQKAYTLWSIYAMRVFLLITFRTNNTHLVTTTKTQLKTNWVARSCAFSVLVNLCVVGVFVVSGWWLCFVLFFLK